MNKERLMKVILAPHVSEKSTYTAGNYHQHIFKVVADATKPEIKKAVEMLFNVEVKGVNVCNMKGKTTRTGRILGRRKGWKKAYVTLASGQEIDVAGAQS